MGAAYKQDHILQSVVEALASQPGWSAPTEIALLLGWPRRVVSCALRLLYERGVAEHSTTIIHRKAGRTSVVNIFRVSHNDINCTSRYRTQDAPQWLVSNPIEPEKKHVRRVHF
jgi:hypothetical protein